MKFFARLFNTLDQTLDAEIKVEALIAYFDLVPDMDKIWAMALLLGKRPKKLLTTTELRSIAQENGDIPNWLFEESYQRVGDLVETIALVFPQHKSFESRSLEHWINFITHLRSLPELVIRENIVNSWMQMSTFERLVFNKLLTGGLRLEVPQRIMTKALERHTGIQSHKIACKLTKNWHPSKTDFQTLILTDFEQDESPAPVTLCAINEFRGDITGLGQFSDWHFERSWDGVRCQLIVSNRQYYLWSERGEVITDKVPEFKELIRVLPPEITIEGILLVINDGVILPITQIESRINKKSISKKMLDECPIIFVANDLLSFEGKQMLQTRYDERKKILDEVIAECNKSEYLSLSSTLEIHDWQSVAEERKQSRSYFSDGLLLKRKDSYYVKNSQSNWLKWKAEPFKINAILIYIGRVQGNLKNEYTFAVWSGEALIPFTKVESNLSVEDEKEIAEFAKANTVERFGPVRTIRPALVFTLIFDGIAKSTRHKCGVSLRFPAIQKWLKKTPIEEANDLPHLLAFLNQYGS